MTETLIKQAEQVFELDDIKKNTNKRAYVTARYAVYYVLRQKTPYSFSRIGKVFNQDHATVMHGVNTISNLLEQPHDEYYRKIHYFINNPEFKKMPTYEELEQELITLKEKLKHYENKIS